MKTHNSFLLNTVTNGSPACSRKKTCYKNLSFQSKIRTEIEALSIIDGYMMLKSHKNKWHSHPCFFLIDKDTNFLMFCFWLVNEWANNLHLLFFTKCYYMSFNINLIKCKSLTRHQAKSKQKQKPIMWKLRYVQGIVSVYLHPVPPPLGPKESPYFSPFL